MSEAITTGVFGTIIVAILVYLVSRVDRLADKVEQLTERLTRVEVKLDEHGHPADH